jgi:diguanylate cyclase (GGDEF)-like protein
MFNAKPKVLIVDDFASIIEVLNDALADDYEILIALNGKEALQVAQDERPDLILLDVVMPGMSGMEVCVLLKGDERTANIPVIFITALNQEMDEELGLMLGAIDFIAKPFSSPVVRARVKNHIKLKRQGDLLREISFVDGLTGVANRRRFDQALEEAWRSGMNSNAPLSLIMVDVDFFQSFNDANGYLAGDDCLRKLTQGLTGLTQAPNQLLARFGRKEFILLLPDTKAAQANALASDIQAMVASLALPHPRSTVSPLLTLSIGVATALPDLEEGAQSLVLAADCALISAKEAGRNRIVSQAP